MKFFEEIKRIKDDETFKIGDKIFGEGAGEYYIGIIHTDDRRFSGICVSGWKNKEDVFKYREYPETGECGFNDLNKIEHIK